MDIYDGKDTSFGYATQKLRQLRHLMEQQDTRKHPKTTRQGFDFYMNLGVYE